MAWRHGAMLVGVAVLAAACIADSPAATADGQPPTTATSPAPRAVTGDWTVALNGAAVGALTVAVLHDQPGASAALAALSGLEKIKGVAAGEPVLADLAGRPLPHAGVTLTRRLDAPVPPTSQVGLAYYDADHDAWTAVPTRLSADRTTLTATADRLGYWTDLVEDVGAGSAAAPECATGAPAWLTPGGPISLGDGDAPLRWCVGGDPRDPALLVVKVRVNRGYGVALTPATAPERVSDSVFASGPEDVLVGVMTGALPLPGDTGRGVLLLPGGAEAVFTFTQDAVRGVGEDPLIRVEPAPGYRVAGTTYTAMTELDPDGDRPAAMLAALLGVAQCGSSVARSVAADDGPGAAQSVTGCLDDHGDEIADRLATTLVHVRPAGDPKDLGAAAGNAVERLRQVWAAGLTFGVAAWSADRDLPAATWTVQVTPGGSQAVGMHDLLTAPVPALCRHAAGRLRGGELPIVDPGAGYGGLALGGPGPVLADLTGDGVGDAATVFRCSAGGVAWPDTVLFHGPGATLLGAAELSTVTNDVDVEHATVSSIAADGTDVVVRWTTTSGCCSDPRSWSARLHWDGHAVRILGAGRA